jgi:hypothetical protein
LHAGKGDVGLRFDIGCRRVVNDLNGYRNAYISE